MLSRPPHRKRQSRLQGKERRKTSTSPPPFSKKAMQRENSDRHQWICPFSLWKHTYQGRGVQNQAGKKNSKNAFRPVLVPKSTFPELQSWDLQVSRPIALFPQDGPIANYVGLGRGGPGGYRSPSCQVEGDRGLGPNRWDSTPPRAANI